MDFEILFKIVNSVGCHMALDDFKAIASQVNIVWKILFYRPCLIIKSFEHYNGKWWKNKKNLKQETWKQKHKKMVRKHV